MEAVEIEGLIGTAASSRRVSEELPKEKSRSGPGSHPVTLRHDGRTHRASIPMLRLKFLA